MSELAASEQEKKVTQDGKGEEEEEEVDDDEEEGGEGEEVVDGEATTSSNIQSSKQKKKKKSKAAKLRKKLGLSSKDQETASISDDKGGKQIASILTDDEVSQLQKAIEKEQGPKAASKADRETLEKLMKMMNLEKTALLKDQEAKQKQHKAIADHKFWKTQPVTKPGELTSDFDVLMKDLHTHIDLI
jgi:glycylpeptide N-tetradecanoyltransferase